MAFPVTLLLWFYRLLWLTLLPSLLDVLSLPLFTFLWSLWAANTEQKFWHRPDLCRDFLMEGHPCSYWDGAGERRQNRSRLSHLEASTDSYPTGAAGKNLYHHLESYTQTHTPNPHLYRGEHDTDISSHVFFTSPYQPLLDFALSNEKWALKPWSLLRDLPRTLLPHGLSGCSQPQESEGGKEKIING